MTARAGGRDYPPAMHNLKGRAPEWVDVSQHATPQSRSRAGAEGSQRALRSAASLVLALGLTAVLVACTQTPATTTAPTLAVATATPVPTAAPTVAPTAAPLPTPAATEAAGTPACTPADLKAEHGIVEGAAGSRLTTVLLTTAIGCSIDAFPAMGLRDASGAILVGAASSGPGRIDLAAGDGYESNVRLANWCADPPDFPLTLEVVLGTDELPVTGGSFPEQGDLPPCSGDGGPILEATAWVVAGS